MKRLGAMPLSRKFQERYPWNWCIISGGGAHHWGMRLENEMRELSPQTLPFILMTARKQNYASYCPMRATRRQLPAGHHIHTVMKYMWLLPTSRRLCDFRFGTTGYCSERVERFVIFEENGFSRILKSFLDDISFLQTIKLYYYMYIIGSLRNV